MTPLLFGLSLIRPFKGYLFDASFAGAEHEFLPSRRFRGQLAHVDSGVVLLEDEPLGLGVVVEDDVGGDAGPLLA